MTGDPPLESQLGVERLEKNRETVRRVYQQTWTEYHAHKPDDARLLKRDRSAGIVHGSASQSRKALHDRLMREKQAAAQRHAKNASDALTSASQSNWDKPPTALPTAVDPSTRYGRYNVNIDAGEADLPGTKTESCPIKQTDTPTPRLPRYDWCTWTSVAQAIPQEFIMPFRPEEMSEARFEAYKSEFVGSAWERGYGGPADLHIMIETLRRLMMDEKLREIDIDRTRVLHKSTMDIETLRLGTELFEFPSPNEPEWRRAESGWDAVGDGDTKRPAREGADGDRMWCVVCSAFFCDRHLEGGLFPVHPRPLPQLRRLELAMPERPCSAKCVWSLDSSTLARVDESQDDLAFSFTRLGKDQIVVLRCLLDKAVDDGDEPRYTYCDAAQAMCGASCRDVALELREWRRYEEVEHKPIVSALTDGITPGLSPERPRRTGKRKTKPVDLGVDFKAARQDFCRHEGPCMVGSCLCANEKANFSCEAGCFCPDDCPRRWKGCTCHATNKDGLCRMATCACWKKGRECDPHLCRCAKSATNAAFNCGNMRHQSLQPSLDSGDVSEKKTVVRVSKIRGAGYGLFAAQDFEQGEVIMEYTGEIIVGTEADRRSSFYDVIGRRYAFALDGDALHVDAYRLGNESRFMNWNSSKFANLTSAAMKVRGNPVILIITSRKVKKGEELRIDYGEDSDWIIRGPDPSGTSGHLSPARILKRKQGGQSTSTLSDGSWTNGAQPKRAKV